MTVSVISPDHALADRLRHIAADAVVHMLGESGLAGVVCTGSGFGEQECARVTVARAGHTVEAEGAARAAEHAVVNAARALRQRLGGPARFHSYGFHVNAEGTFNGVTIPTQITGGWGYRTDACDPATAAFFTITDAALATSDRPLLNPAP